jgi:hypothetical protein
MKSSVMHPSAPAAPMLTFVLRFQCEITVGEVRMRGRIEHVQSGEAIAFMDFETMLRFLQHFGIRAGDQDRLWYSPEVS